MPSPDLDGKPEPDECPNAAAVVNQRLAEIDALIQSEDFAGIERLVQALPELVASVPDSARESVLLTIQGFLNRVQTQAESKSEHIRASLQKLKNGRAATIAYTAAGKLTMQE